MSSHGMDPHSLKKASLADTIRLFVERVVAAVRTKTRYRTPLVGFAQADDPAWSMIRERVNPDHLLPTDILPGAQSVVAFFIPFSHRVVTENKRHFYVSPEWAQAYGETNALIDHLCQALGRMLGDLGVLAAHQPPTHNFDPKTLRSPWSHKSVAYVAGLGEWGLHRMLITERGAAGRFGSLVIDAALPPTPRPDSIYCSFYRDGTCMECVKQCQVRALAVNGLDRERCHRTCMEVSFFYQSQFGKADVCGKCVTGPCAFHPPARSKKKEG